MLQPWILLKYTIATIYIFLFIAGCGEGDIGLPCSAEPADGDEDFVSDMWHTSCPVAPDELEPAACEPPTVADIEAQCEAEGAPCEGAIVVGRDEAICAAKDGGIREGLEGLYADLMFHDRLAKPVWSVSNVLEDDGAGTSRGSSFVVDAETGAVLDRTEWEVIP